VREKIRGKVFLGLQVSLWAMHEEIKKQKGEKQRTKKTFVLEWYPLGVKESLDHAQDILK